MDSVNNLVTLVFTLIPIFSYVFMLFFLIPSTYVSIHRSRRYLISGLMSPFIIFLFYFLFPWWGDSYCSSVVLKYLLYAIIQIGLLEEFSKYCVFQWVNSERISAKNDLPVAVMFYSLMTSLGFALTENLSYILAHYNLNSQNPFMTSTDLKNSMMILAGSRSLTAVIMHMICGVIMGYFLTRTTESNLKTKYTIIGIAVAALFHGVYDVNLMLPGNDYKILFTVIILSFGIIISYFMTRILIDESTKIRNCKLN